MKRPVIILFHIGYWVLYTLFITLILALLNKGGDIGVAGDPRLSKIKILIVLYCIAFVPAFVAFYSYYFWLFDSFLRKKRILLLFIVGLATAYISGYVGVIFNWGLNRFGIGVGAADNGIVAGLEFAFILFFVALPNGGMGLLLRGFIRWYQELKLNEDLTKKNFETELALVKSQLDPHFLFNSLNNIDALIIKNPDMASVYLHKLSDIMRFMLYETKGERIPLSKEWSYIEKFIDLQKIRTANDAYVQCEKLGNTDGTSRENREGVFIAPMILIPFVENAFKHAEKIKVGNAVKIILKLENDTLHFECGNRFIKTEYLENEVGGLGNGLIIKRLELLYPQKHTLRIEEKDNFYSVCLSIQF
jgi:two-component system, LytTR family, sensor kinase